MKHGIMCIQFGFVYPCCQPDFGSLLQADFSINVHIVSFKFDFSMLSTPSGKRLITVLD